MGESFFIDENGEIISYPDIESHIGLAKKVLEDNPLLKAKYEKSGIKDPTDFLIRCCKLIKVSEQGFYRKVVFNSSTLSDKQRELIRDYTLKGYEMEDTRIMDMRKGEER